MRLYLQTKERMDLRNADRKNIIDFLNFKSTEIVIEE